MKSATAEYQKGKWLVVDYPSCDDKPEYRKPILCRARDIGEIIYGKWIIGGEQCGHFQNDSYSDEAERYFTAYKLVQGAGITCNFALDVSDAPFITKIAYPGDESRADASWDYSVNSHIDSYRPRCEPEIDGIDNGMIYIKMPSGAETKQTDDAAEEKFTLFPQLQKDDIVRYVSRLSGVEIIDVATYEHLDDYFYSIGEVVAIDRFDGKDFKCIWESEEYNLRKWKEALANAAESARRAGVSLKEVTAAFERLIKEKSKKGEQ